MNNEKQSEIGQERLAIDTFIHYRGTIKNVSYIEMIIEIIN